MPSTIPAAFPFVQVTINTAALVPAAQRAPGVIAVVGDTPANAAGGVAVVNTPYVVATLDDAATLFAQKVGGVVAKTPLYSALEAAFAQDPAPSKIYGVRSAGGAYAAALAALEGVDDVTFVSLANEKSVGAAAAEGTPATGLMALKEHVETVSAQGARRLGVAMVDPTVARSPGYVASVVAAVTPLKSGSGRMVLVAARGATGDAATAAMSAMAAYDPHISLVLKKIRGITLPLAGQYGPGEIRALSEEGINPVIDPSLVVGESLHFAEGRTFTTDAALAYVDIVRVLDDLEFRLKAGLIRMVGDARITKPGLTHVRVRMDEILGPLRSRQVIADYSVSIPLLDILNLPESAWTAADRSVVQDARGSRTVDMDVSVTYGPAVHRLRVTLSPTF